MLDGSRVAVARRRIFLVNRSCVVVAAAILLYRGHVGNIGLGRRRGVVVRIAVGRGVLLRARHLIHPRLINGVAVAIAAFTTHAVLLAGGHLARAKLLHPRCVVGALAKCRIVTVLAHRGRVVVAGRTRHDPPGVALKNFSLVTGRIIVLVGRSAVGVPVLPYLRTVAEAAVVLVDQPRVSVALLQYTSKVAVTCRACSVSRWWRTGQATFAQRTAVLVYGAHVAAATTLGHARPVALRTVTIRPVLVNRGGVGHGGGLEGTCPVAVVGTSALVLADGRDLVGPRLILNARLVGTILVERGGVLGKGCSSKGQQHPPGKDNFFHFESRCLFNSFSEAISCVSG